MNEEFKGRLELTWTNKEKRLLASEGGDYSWVLPADYRVAEVRLLNDAGAVGDTQPGRRRAGDNLLIRGDALNALTSLCGLPEFANECLGQVKLAYLDPPFNTQQSFLQYDDALEHSVWLTMMRDRLMQVRALLADDGSVWVHCDDSEQHRLRSVLDEVFGPECFVATVVWQKRTSRENRKAIGSAHDYLHVYSPKGPTRWREVRNTLSRDPSSASNPDGDERGPWDSIPFSAQGYRKNQDYDIVSPTGAVLRPPKGRCWGATEPVFEELLAENRIYWPRKGAGRPRVKQFVDEQKGLVPMTWWPASEVGDNEEAKKEILGLFPNVEPFATPKPERLMRQIVEIATNPGDLVLDCFGGSATTAAAAHKLGRRWIVTERSEATIRDYAFPRLSAIVRGEDHSGITEQVGWEGGSGFRLLEVAPSMFEAVDGTVFIAEWASNGKLAEATAAQLGFEFEFDPPFVGAKGRSRLAVIDGLVNVDVARMLVEALSESELLTLCGTAVDPEVRSFLRDVRRGSIVRKIPASILADYRSQEWDLPVDPAG